jgi:hypothetical protein
MLLPQLAMGVAAVLGLAAAGSAAAALAHPAASRPTRAAAAIEAVTRRSGRRKCLSVDM